MPAHEYTHDNERTRVGYMNALTEIADSMEDQGRILLHGAEKIREAILALVQE